MAKSLGPSPFSIMIRVAISRFSSLNFCSGLFGSPPASRRMRSFKPCTYIKTFLLRFCTSCALGYHICALVAVADSVVFCCKEANMVSVDLFTVELVFSKLRLTVLKAFNISDDTFRASKAVRTRYIILIIFCLGSRGKAMTFGFYFSDGDLVSKNQGYGISILKF